MLEHLFSEQNELTDNADVKPRTNKRRKTDSPAVQDFDDDDGAYYANFQGKKAKGGTGYAGDQKEDVSSDGFPTPTWLIRSSILDKSKPKLPNVPKMKRLENSSLPYVYISPICIERAVVGQATT